MERQRYYKKIESIVFYYAFLKICTHLFFSKQARLINDLHILRFVQYIFITTGTILYIFVILRRIFLTYSTLISYEIY